jgi:hypothetical protein
MTIQKSEGRCAVLTIRWRRNREKRKEKYRQTRERDRKGEGGKEIVCTKAWNKPEMAKLFFIPFRLTEKEGVGPSHGKPSRLSGSCLRRIQGL